MCGLVQRRESGGRGRKSALCQMLTAAAAIRGGGFRVGWCGYGWRRRRTGVCMLKGRKGKGEGVGGYWDFGIWDFAWCLCMKEGGAAVGWAGSWVGM